MPASRRTGPEMRERFRARDGGAGGRRAPHADRVPPAPRAARALPRAAAAAAAGVPAGHAAEDHEYQGLSVETLCATRGHPLIRGREGQLSVTLCEKGLGGVSFVMLDFEM